MNTDNGILHLFESVPEGLSLPSQFTFPFHYTPHPLTLMAAHRLQQYIISRTDWASEISKGKMFGVLVVSTPQGQIGFLAAFSGNLAGSNHHSYFVPPVYDMLHPDGFFRIEEKNISNINLKVSQLEASSSYQQAVADLESARADIQLQLTQARTRLKEEKRQRDLLRQQSLSAETQHELIHQSQHQKAEFKRLESHLRALLAAKESVCASYTNQIEQLKEERKKRSAVLQLKLFAQFHLLNALGESKDLCQIFKSTPQGIPPAGAGECALPKLLQYAYLHHMHPLSMGEFWWGASPSDKIRRQGQFYPSCTSKCAPILKHMLIGLNVEPNPLLADRHKDTQLDIVYEDEWLLVVNKPEGMLSVPGKDGLNSVYQYIRTKYPETNGPLIVHRLDMATSGLLLVAKTKEIHEKLQRLFETREVEKTYMAIVQGELPIGEGIIRLPLCPDINHRPQQIVSHELGKPAITLYKVIRTTHTRSLVAFRPITGRTHQLRVHAAHPEGLNHPIVGDELYGTADVRLMLHAQRLSFIHPVTGKRIKVEVDPPFTL